MESPPFIYSGCHYSASALCYFAEMKDQFVRLSEEKSGFFFNENSKVFKHYIDQEDCIYGLNLTQGQHLSLEPLLLISDLEAIVFSTYSTVINYM